MADLHWETPPEYRCDGCGKEAKGAIGAHASGSTVSRPAGWSSAWDRHAQKMLYACSERCRHVVTVERKMGA